MILVAYVNNCVLEKHAFPAGQTCTISSTDVTAKGLVPGGDDGQCEGTNAFTLYGVTLNNDEKKECGLTCIDGWFRVTGDPSPKVWYNPDTSNGRTSSSGLTRYIECQRTYVVYTSAHNGIVCRIVDLLL